MPTPVDAEAEKIAPRSARDPRDTPAMRQFRRFKTEQPGCVLFFRMGDFYEMFDDDAVLANRVLGITLTERTTGIPMAGVPYHALEPYLRKMIDAGHRVAVCEQIQDPREAKGVVERAVTRVLTPGTLVDEALLDESAANVIAAVHVGARDRAVLAFAELSTGRFELLECPAADLEDELTRLHPSELLHAEGDGVKRWAAWADANDCALTARPAWTFRRADARDLLRAHYGVRTLTGFGLGDDDDALPPCGALLRYLQETQTPDAADPGSHLAHLAPPARRASDEFLVIDATSLASLEIERTMRSGRTQGSLLSTLQRCKTPMGKRLLRRWLCFPLRDRAAIEARQNAVAALEQDAELAARLGAELGSVQDVARIAARIAMGRATPRDVAALGVSTGRGEALRELLAGTPALHAHRDRLAGLVESLAPLADRIHATCVDDPPAHMRDGGLFRDGFDETLDEARGLQRDADAWLAEYQQGLVDEHAIPSLKVGFNKVFGYYIEITNTHRDKVPDAFTRKQTLKNAERYVTPELKTFEERVTTASSRAVEREKTLFDELCAESARLAPALARYADLVAELDVLTCFADVAQRYGYVRPTLVDEATLDIRGGRHPVLDRTLGDGFVPNDCALGPPEATLALITGPNMAGKSTYIRQVAIIALLAHTGCSVPAESATIGITDRIFTRIGASDELHAGQSTFMVEMTETANILHHATSRSLVILDEIGRGTSTLDGLALAWAIAETIADIGCRACFATHYHELTSLADRLDHVTNRHVSVREWGDEIVFLYRILPGRTGQSYGIHVAKIAGVPDPTIARVRELLETLVVHGEHAEAAVIPPPAATAPPAGRQLGLFTEYVEHPAIGRLRDVTITELTPLAAFDVLRELVAFVHDQTEPAEDGPSSRSQDAP